MSMNGIFFKNEVIKINKGSDKEFELHFFTEEGKNFDLTDYTIFQVCIKARAGDLSITQVANVNGSLITKQSPDQLGRLTVLIKAADVAGLDERENQEIYAKIEKASGEKQTFRFEDALSVYSNPCA